MLDACESEPITGKVGRVGLGTKEKKTRPKTTWAQTKTRPDFMLTEKHKNSRCINLLVSLNPSRVESIIVGLNDIIEGLPRE